MPQIWLTYDELTEAFGDEFADPRNKAIDLGLARMKGSDGITTVRLSASMAQGYLSRMLASIAQERQTPVHDIAALEAIVKSELRLPRLFSRRAA